MGPASRYLEPCTLASTCLRLARPVSLLNVRDSCYIARHSGSQVPNSRRVFSSRARAFVPTSGTRVPSGHATLCMSRHGHELPVRPPGVLDKYQAGATRRQHERADREWLELAKAALNCFPPRPYSPRTVCASHLSTKKTLD